MNRSYTRKARFGIGPDAPIVDLIWYPTELPFLPFPSFINTRELETDDTREDIMGEVFSPYPPKPNWHAGIPGLTGEHFCGTPDMFLNGAPGYTGPPIEYDADHIPKCCGRGLVPFVSAGARPAALVEHSQDIRARSTAGIRPASVVEQTHTLSALVAGGARPAALVEQIPQTPLAVSAGARPAALVTQTHAPQAMVSAGARPAALYPSPIPLPVLVSVGVRPAVLIAEGTGCQRETPNCGAALSGPLNLLCYTQVPTPGNRWWRWDYGGGPGWVFRTGRGTLASYSGTYTIFAGDDCGLLDVVATGIGMPLFTDWPLPAGKTRVYVRQFFAASPIGIPDIRWGAFLT